MSTGDLICEYYGSRKHAVYRIQRGWQSRGVSQIRPIEKGAGVAKRFNSGAFFREVFLPQGYPDSVTDDYLEYQCWDTMQAFCSSLTGTLATEAVMKGVGVGDQSATALAATLTWLLKDGAGMVGRIMFAYAKGSLLDCDSKSWRLVADFLNDLAIFVNILSPYFKPFFTYIICFSSICTSIVGVAGGATRAALTQHQARRNNLADVSAKDGSQETLVNLSALLCSMLLIPMVSGKGALVWTLFCILTALHLFANYRAVRSLRMDTINESRYRILIKHFFGNGPMNIGHVNAAEPLLVNLGLVGGKCQLEVGCRLTDIPVFDENCDKERKYEIGIGSSGGGLCGWWTRRNSWVIRVALRADASAVDVLRAVFHAELVRMELMQNRDDRRDHMEILATTRATVSHAFPIFLERLKEHGWVTSYTLLNCDEWRYCPEKDGHSYKAV